MSHREPQAPSTPGVSTHAIGSHPSQGLHTESARFVPIGRVPTGADMQTMTTIPSLAHIRTSFSRSGRWRDGGDDFA